MTTETRSLLVLAAAIAALMATAHVVAQSFPAGPVKIVYPFPAGSGGDIATRVLAAESEKALGQPVIVENRPGAGGRLGIHALAASQGNAHTLSVVVNGVMVVLPLADPSFRVEAGRDYTPVMLAFESYSVLVGRPALPYRDVKGLIAHARENGGKINIASSGIGGNPHLIAELLKSKAGIDMVHVPYRGESPALADMMAGQVDLMFTTAGAKTYIDSGKLVGLATTGPRRWKLFPGLPTMEEAGVPGVEATTWWGIAAPAGTPADVVAKLNAAFRSALEKPAVVERMSSLGLEVLATSPQEFATRIEADRARWAPVIKGAGIKFE